MADFVVSLGWMPDDYYALTFEERNAIAKAMNKRTRK